MADEIKQLAFKKFTSTELQNGTAADVLTTDASTHYVVKSIEATQGYNSDAVTATATIGLTAGKASGDYTSLGIVAKQNRTGASGSVIMDASSTLSIRPVAKSIIYADEQMQYGMESNSTPKKFRKVVTPTVNGVSDTAIITRETIDKTAQTFSGGSVTLNQYTNNHSFIYTRDADGVSLKVIVQCNTSSGCGFEVFNADDGTYYGYYWVSYCAPHWDGGRYMFFWNENNRQQIAYYDLEESLTNLAAANTYGGGNGANFYHGVINDPAGSNHPSYSISSFDNRGSTYYFDRHENRRFLMQYWSGQTLVSMAEFPAGTFTNYDATANEWTKWVIMGTQSASTSTDPFGNNSGQSWNICYWTGNYCGNSQRTFRMTWDNDLQRYFVYVWSGNYVAPFTWTKAEYDATPSGSVITTPHTTGYGLIMISDYSAGNIDFDTAWYTSYSSHNGVVQMSDLQSNLAAGSPTWDYNSNNERWVDGRTLVMGDHSTPNRIWKISFRNGVCSEITTGMTDAEANVNYNKSFWWGQVPPSASTIASRSYSVSPGLKVRVTGIKSDQ